MKIAQYNKKFHFLTYWNSRNTQISIDCRTYKCAKLVVLTTEKMRGYTQKIVQI